MEIEPRRESLPVANSDAWALEQNHTTSFTIKEDLQTRIDPLLTSRNGQISSKTSFVSINGSYEDHSFRKGTLSSGQSISAEKNSKNHQTHTTRFSKRYRSSHRFTQQAAIEDGPHHRSVNSMGGKAMSKRGSGLRKRSVGSGSEIDKTTILALTSKAWKERKSHRTSGGLRATAQDHSLLSGRLRGTQQRRISGQTSPEAANTVVDARRSIVRSRPTDSAELQNASAGSKSESEPLPGVDFRLEEARRVLDLQPSGQDGASDFIPAMPGGLYGDEQFVSKAAFEAIIQPEDLLKALSNEPGIGTPAGTVRQEVSENSSVHANGQQIGQTASAKSAGSGSSSHRSSLGR